MTWEFCTVRSWPHFFFLSSLRAPRSSRAPTTHLPKVYGTHTSHGSCICSPHCIVLALRVSCGLSFHLPLVLCNILFPRLMRRRSRALTSASRVTPWSTSNCFSPSVVHRCTRCFSIRLIFFLIMLRRKSLPPITHLSWRSFLS